MITNIENFKKIMIMGNLLQDLKMYFKHTPKDIIEKNMKDLDKYNKTGPDMLDILPNKEDVFRG